MDKLLIFKEDIDLTGFTAIVPSLGVGNVSQLAVDLIISTLEMKQVAVGFHNALIPIFGPSAFQHEPESFTHAMNAYLDTERKLLVLQIRSPLVKQFMRDFLEKLTEFLKNSQVSRVVILGSCFSFEKKDMESSCFEYISNEQFEKLNADNKIDLVRNLREDPIAGDGWGLRLLKVCTASQLPAVMFYKYSAEGDNTFDASSLCTEVNKYITIFDSKEPAFKIPESWKLLFGNEPVASLY